MAREPVRMMLIEVMRTALEERPFSRVSLNEICSSACISKRTFYRHYHDKYALLADTYKECFFSKINVSEGDPAWDIFAKVCTQICENQTFFLHCFNVSGQNGFRNEFQKIFYPYLRADCPIAEDVDKSVEKISDFFIYSHIDLMLSLIDDWLKQGCRPEFDEYFRLLRSSFAVFGTWTYQLATNQPRYPFEADYKNNIKW